MNRHHLFSAIIVTFIVALANVGLFGQTLVETASLLLVVPTFLIYGAFITRLSQQAARWFIVAWLVLASGISLIQITARGTWMESAASDLAMVMIISVIVWLHFQRAITKVR